MTTTLYFAASSGDIPLWGSEETGCGARLRGMDMEIELGVPVGVGLVPTRSPESPWDAGVAGAVADGDVAAGVVADCGVTGADVERAGTRPAPTAAAS